MGFTDISKTGFSKSKTGSHTVWLANEFADSRLRDVLADGLSSLHHTYPLEKVPTSKFADVYKFTYTDDFLHPVFYFKQYHYRSLWDFIKHMFRPSRAKRTMRAAAMLRANGFTSPEIISIGYVGKGPFSFDNFLLTREVENALPIYSFFSQRFENPGARSFLSDKRKFITVLGRFVGSLHTKNISHGDLRMGNVLLRQNGSEWEFFLLDNERTIQYRNLPNRLRLKNLVQVNMYRPSVVTNTDRMRFFRAYLTENPSLTHCWKTWARRIHKRTQRRLLKIK
jgi:hypothetical protein